MKTKLSRKAIALLRKVQKTITEEPNRLLMADWAGQTRQGTVGCIAGWTAILGLTNLPTVILNGQEMVDVSAIPDVETDAATLLGIDKKEAEKLFYLKHWGFGNGWPLEFDEAYGNAKTAQERAKVTCDRIDYFIEHVA